MQLLNQPNKWNEKMYSYLIRFFKFEIIIAIWFLLNLKKWTRSNLFDFKMQRNIRHHNGTRNTATTPPEIRNPTHFRIISRPHICYPVVACCVVFNHATVAKCTNFEVTTLLSLMPHFRLLATTRVKSSVTNLLAGQLYDQPAVS